MLCSSVIFKYFKNIYMKYNVTLKIRKANCDSRSGLAAEKQIRTTGILPRTRRSCSRGFGMPNVSVHWFWGAHGSSPVWPSVKLAGKHDCWSVPQVSRPTLHRRVYTWLFPITWGFSSLLQGTQTSSVSEDFAFGMSHSAAKNHLSEVLPT